VKWVKQFRGGEGMAPGGAVKVSPVTVSKTFGFPSPKPWKPETFGPSVTGTPPWQPRPPPRCAA